MARKRTLIPAFPVESRMLSWALFAAGIVLLLAGWASDSNGILVMGAICVAGALLALIADRVLGDLEDEDP